jgi:hypothetical protein
MGQVPAQLNIPARGLTRSTDLSADLGAAFSFAKLPPDSCARPDATVQMGRVGRVFGHLPVAKISELKFGHGLALTDRATTAASKQA